MRTQKSAKSKGHAKAPQLRLLKNQTKAYGGELLRTRKGRSQPRPLDTKSTMHLVLRSAKATGKWSFRRREHAVRIEAIIKKFAAKNGVRVLSMANVGNHLHLQIKLGTRYGYRPFIRATTAAIAMAVTNTNRWTYAREARHKKKEKFWDYRPFTRVVIGLKAFLNLRDYIAINQLEGSGDHRAEAVWFIKNQFKWKESTA